MDRERAETYLRRLIEAELRRAAAAPDGRAAEAAAIVRAARVANVLIAAGRLGEDSAGELIDDLRLALGVRRAEWPGGANDPAPRSRHLLSGRHPAMPQAVVRPLPSAGQQDASAPGADRVVPVGQLIGVGDGEICVLAYAQTEAGALLTLVAAGGPFGMMELVEPVPGSPIGRIRPMPPFGSFTATDAAGTSYRLQYRGTGTPRGECTVRLTPAPPRDLRWLDLRTAPGGPAVRIDLNRPAASTEVTIREAATSPGELLLGNLAMYLLTEPVAWPLTEIVDGLGDVLAALQAAGALSPLSPVPGQFVALCAQLNLDGHGITAPPARDLPARWLSLLTDRRRRKPRPEPGRGHAGYAVAAAGLPELDGVRICLLGLRNAGGGTVAQVYVSRQAWPSYWGPAQLNMAPAIWIRDSDGRWHGTRFTRSGDLAMRLQVVPPLTPGTTWIEIVAAGQSAEVRATAPLRWR